MVITIYDTISLSLCVYRLHLGVEYMQRNMIFHREVNNRLTGWAFAHPVNAHPVNSTCPFPKIAHPVNYLAHRKMGTTIIKNKQLIDLSFLH